MRKRVRTVARVDDKHVHESPPGLIRGRRFANEEYLPSSAMAVVLAYVDAVPGRLYPLVPTLQELVHRGHRVAVRCGPRPGRAAGSIGLAAESIAPRSSASPPRTGARERDSERSGRAWNSRASGHNSRSPISSALSQAERPDVLLIDEGSLGCRGGGRAIRFFPGLSRSSRRCRSPSRDAPPFGLGLAPRHDRVGRHSGTGSFVALLSAALERMMRIAHEPGSPARSACRRCGR